jgi:hypothetical protein
LQLELFFGWFPGLPPAAHASQLPAAPGGGSLAPVAGMGAGGPDPALDRDRPRRG